jgi:hypothetical protein
VLAVANNLLAQMGMPIRAIVRLRCHRQRSPLSSNPIKGANLEAAYSCHWGKNMTLVIALSTRDSVWLTVDQRLTFKAGPKDTATKVMHLHGSDGIAMLGYAGLGATEAGMEPSWMSNVFRGRPTAPLEESLGFLSAVAKTELPRHLAQLNGDAAQHVMLAAALVNGEPRLYSIDLAADSGAQLLRSQYTRHVVANSRRGDQWLPHPCVVAGSGGVHLRSNWQWIRDTLSLIKAMHLRRVQHDAIAERLAHINYTISKRCKTVSPGCIVSWCLRGGNVSSLSFTGVGRTRDSWLVPTIANGVDIKAVCEIASSHPMGWTAKDGCVTFGEQAQAIGAMLRQGPDTKLS